MGYAATTGVILYCNPYQFFVIYIAHHIWFDEYNYCLYIEYNHTMVSLLLQKEPEILLRNSDLIYFIIC